jgi:hypothetical protein
MPLPFASVIEKSIRNGFGLQICLNAQKLKRTLGCLVFENMEGRPCSKLQTHRQRRMSFS